LVKERANIIAVHDIVDVNCPDVVEVWLTIKREYKETFDFFEFVDQYEEHTKRRPNVKFLGIGVAVKRCYARS
jgi:hypothetical protein